MNRWVDWQALSQRRRVVRLLLLMTCCVLTVVLGHALHLRSLSAGLEQAQSQARSVLLRWQDKHAQAALVDDHQAQVDELHAEVRQASLSLLDDAGLPLLLREISHIGQGLAFEQVRVQEGQGNAFAAPLPIQLSVVGRYALLADFVEALGEMATLVSFHDLQLAPVADAAPGLLRLQLLIRAYRPAQSRAAAGPELAALPASRDPFQPGPQAAVPALLQRFTLDQISGVGSLTGAGRRVALVRAGGTLLAVQAGDLLGKERARVAHVAEQHLELVEPSRTIRWGQQP